jgi:DNA gyrase/topoisomerase IV subunit A
LNNIIVNDPDDKIIQAFNFANNLEDKRCLIIATKKGIIKRTLIKDLGISKLTKIATVIKLDEGDLISSCVISDSIDNPNELIGVVSKYGMGLFYPSNQISVVSRNAAGVKNITLRDEDEVSAIFIDDVRREFILLGCIQGMKRIRRDAMVHGNRTNVGKSLISQIKSNPIEVLNVFEVNMNELINNLSFDGAWSLIKASEIIIGDNETRVSLVKGKRSTFINKIDFINEQENETTIFDK